MHRFKRHSKREPPAQHQQCINDEDILLVEQTYNKWLNLLPSTIIPWWTTGSVNGSIIRSDNRFVGIDASCLVDGRCALTSWPRWPQQSYNESTTFNKPPSSWTSKTVQLPEFDRGLKTGTVVGEAGQQRSVTDPGRYSPSSFVWLLFSIKMASLASSTSRSATSLLFWNRNKGN